MTIVFCWGFGDCLEDKEGKEREYNTIFAFAQPYKTRLPITASDKSLV